LCNSEFHKIYETDIDGKQVQRMFEGSGLYSIRRRDPVVVELEKDKTREQLQQLTQHILFSFGDGMTGPRDDLPKERRWQGITLEDVWTDRIFIRLDYHILSPLLLKQLIVSRLAVKRSTDSIADLARTERNCLSNGHSALHLSMSWR
jgi:hypothetical protein